MRNSARAVLGMVAATLAMPAAFPQEFDCNLPTVPVCGFQVDPGKCVPGQRQINICGATLFRAFFEAPSSTTDFIDVDCDGCFGFSKPPAPGCGDVIDQLAPASPAFASAYWIVQHRSVGSLKGFEEFVSYQLCCDLPDTLPTERSTINHQLYWDGQSIVWPGPTCNQDIDADALPDLTGTPVCHCSMDLAIVDVVSPWVVVAPGGTPQWSRKPTQPGYGLNPRVSNPIGIVCSSPGPEPSLLESVERDCDQNPDTPNDALNFSFDSPDNKTIYDTTICFVAVVPIANRGVFGDQFDPSSYNQAPAVTYSDLQHGLVTGRMRNGENLAFGTRDTGSGTRNAYNNSLGVDPSWGNGDNRGGRTKVTSDTNLGPCHRTTNCGSSSHIENAVRQRRLCIGYSGLSGNTAAADDAWRGFYEILNVIKDIAPYKATLPVRPTVSTILDNRDPNLGYTIGGSQTFVSRGHRDERDPGSPIYMENQHAADYLRNIVGSIETFVEPGGSEDPNQELSPGQYLARSFFLFGGLDAEQATLDPTLFVDVVEDPVLQEYIRQNNTFDITFAGATPIQGIVTPPYGNQNVAGLCPANSANPADPNVLTAYTYYTNTGPKTILGGTGSSTAGQKLSKKNRLHADFNQDGKRDLSDIPKMMECLFNKSTFDVGIAGATGGDSGDMVANVIVPDIMGDQDGDGQFDAKDVRYFADGLAIDPAAADPNVLHSTKRGKLNRKLGFELVDNTAQTLAPGTYPDGNYFGTQFLSPSGAVLAIPWKKGWSRYDVSNPSTDPHLVPFPGDKPNGADGKLGVDDMRYIVRNFGRWDLLDQAVNSDLSCDTNGDLRVDWCDIAEFLAQVPGYSPLPPSLADIGPCQADLDLDGVVAQPDLGILLANYGGSGKTWFQGDLDCDGVVLQPDLGLMLANYGKSCSP
jgi:hypothetical protein